MYIKNLKVANFWLCFWETFFDVYFIFYYFIMNSTPLWITIPVVILGAIAIIITWVDYIKHATKKENEHETLD